MDNKEILEEQFKKIVDNTKTDSLSNYASKLSNGISDDFTLDKILQTTLDGKGLFDSKEIINDLKDLFLFEIKEALVLGVEIMLICVAIGILRSLSSSFGKDSVSKLAVLICSVVITGLVLNNFNTMFILVNDTLKTITYTMTILLPMLLAILISMGAVASGTIMSPLLLTSITIFENIFTKFVMPLFFISTILILLNSLTEKDYVNKMSKFLRNTAIFTTGIIITIMSGIIAIQGLITKTSDGLLIGTARYSLDAFIPIVGGFTSDTIELFVKCMGSIKNVLGIFGIIIIIILLITPLIKILAIAIIYKIIAMLIEPISPSKISQGINEMGTSLISMGAVLFFSALLFLIFITSIINLGG